MKVVIAGANAAKLVIYPIAPGPMPGGNLPMKTARAPGSYRRWQLRGSDQTTNGHVRQQGGTND